MSKFHVFYFQLVFAKTYFYGRIAFLQN